MALVPMAFKESPIKTISINTTSSANGNIELNLSYTVGVPLACQVKANGVNAYAIIGRWSDAETGHWGAKIVNELNTNGQVMSIANTSISGTLYYIEL